MRPATERSRTKRILHELHELVVRRGITAERFMSELNMFHLHPKDEICFSTAAKLRAGNASCGYGAEVILAIQEWIAKHKTQPQPRKPKPVTA